MTGRRVITAEHRLLMRRAFRALEDLEHRWKIQGAQGSCSPHEAAADLPGFLIRDWLFTPRAMFFSIRLPDRCCSFGRACSPSMGWHLPGPQAMHAPAELPERRMDEC